MKDLYAELKKNNVEIDHYQSDLHFPVNEITGEVLNKFPMQKKHTTVFRSETDGRLMYETPFGYTPFWDKKVKNQP